jgi:phosphatidylglycerophosphate synthase
MKTRALIGSRFYLQQRKEQIVASKGARRQLKTRETGWARALAGALTRAGISPNSISVFSVLIAGVGAALLFRYRLAPWALVLAVLCIQLRLLANLLDGMVAVEGGRGTPVGALYNEVPDRLADSLFLVAAGYAVGSHWLGWCAALMAMLTAYIRTLGGALGQPQAFLGPMAKQHRMALLSLGALCQAAESVLFPGSHFSLLITLAVIVIGSTWTCIRRLRHIAKLL